VVPKRIEGPFLVVCEGKADEAVFSHLVEARNIVGFQFAYPENPPDPSGGIHGFASLLGGLIIREPEIFNLRAIVIATDNDTSRPDPMRLVINQVTNAGIYKVPNSALEVAPSYRSTERYPPVIIMPVPWVDVPGTLETLCLNAAYDKWCRDYPDFQDRLNDYIQSTPASEWHLGNESKARMQCIIGTTCEEDPNTPLARLWHRRAEYHFDLMHDSFNQIDEFFRNLPDWLDERLRNHRS